MQQFHVKPPCPLPAYTLHLMAFLTLLLNLSSSAIAQEPTKDLNPKITEAVQYRIMLCADVPHSTNTDKVYYKGEPGHVFIRLIQQNHQGEIKESLEFGFYPVHPVSSLLFRKAKSKLVTNRGRNFEASITCNISAIQYELAIEKALELSKKAYHLNRFNCYHYAIQVFNSVSRGLQIPERAIKFPFIAGKGGSPCALFADLIKLRVSAIPEAYKLNFPGKEIQPLYSSISSIQ